MVSATHSLGQWVAIHFAWFLWLNHVRHTKSTPYHPSTNGAVERLVRTFKFKQAMKTGNSSGLSSKHQLETFLLSMPHTITQVTPCSLFLGLWDTYQTRSSLQPNISQHLHYNRRELTIGQQFMGCNYWTGPAWTPVTVTQVFRSHTIFVSVQTGDVWSVTLTN